MKTSNPDHNLWNNNGTWWCRFTVHYPDYTAGRVAKSLNTSDKIEARRLRDRLMKSTPGARLPELQMDRFLEAA
jgi:hypothetical protein